MAERAAEGVPGAEAVDDLDRDRRDDDLLVARRGEDSVGAELDDGELDAEVEQRPRRVGGGAIADERDRLVAAADGDRRATDRFAPPLARFVVRAPEHRPVVEVVNRDRTAPACVERGERRRAARLGGEPGAGRPEERHARRSPRGRARPRRASCRAPSAPGRREGESGRAGRSRRTRSAFAASGAFRRATRRRRTRPAPAACRRRTDRRPPS